MASSSLNYPLLSIPVYYVFSLVPHIYAGSILSANGYKVNNANPKASLSPDAIKGKVPDAVFQKYQRAENAQSNNLEQLPLYATAVLASVLAERVTATGLGKTTVGDDVTGLTTFIVAFMAVRSVSLSFLSRWKVLMFSVLPTSSPTSTSPTTARASSAAHSGPSVLGSVRTRSTRLLRYLAKGVESKLRIMQ